MKNYQLILLCVASFGSMYLISAGVAQKYVYFADVENEMFTAAICGMMGIMSLTGIDYKKIIKALF